jgi:outer membrane protein assembly factor BamB
MKANITPVLILIISLFSGTELISQVKPERQWTSYRGNLASGVLDNANLPSSFDFDKLLNVRWKIPVPGMGISSPVIWDDKLFITTAVSEADKAGFKPGLYGDVTSVKDSSVHEWKVFCINRSTGKIIWENTSFKGIPKVKRHPKSTHANPSVATDGKHVVAFFGSEGLYCYDFNGKLLWKKDLGTLKAAWITMKDAEWEFASSPIIYKGSLVIQVDVLGDSFIASYDVHSGKELWKTKRDDYPAWSTPNIYLNGNRPCVVVNGYKHMGGYDLQTGKEIWRMSGGGDIPIPTPVIGENLIYFNSAHGKFSPIIAVKKDAAGDITPGENETSNQFVEWSQKRGGSYIHTMLLYHNRLYNVAWNGMINCIDPLTGKEIYKAKLGQSSSFIASPVASDGRIYIVDELGTVYIIQDGDTFRQLAEIPMNDVCMSAPAIADGAIYFRTQHFLFCVGNKSE